MWFAIMVTVLAASGNNIGKVLQKQATRTLPKLTLRRDIINQYLRSSLWLTGMLTDLAGALLMIVAFAYAPVSVVQPVSAVGLVVLLIFSHFYLKERLQAHEWFSAAVAFAGVLGLGASSEPSHLEHPDASAARILGSFCLMVLVLAAECWWRHSHQHSQASSGTTKHGRTSTSVSGAGASTTDAVLCGLEAGACFGFSAASCRTGFILAAKQSMFWVPLGLLASVMLTSSGFLLQTRGLKAGNTVVVCTMAATSSMLSGVLAGLVALGEKLPTGHGMKVVRLGSWLCILLGVTSLAGGSEGVALLARGLAAYLRPPQWVWRLLPRPLALLLHRLEKRRDELAGEGVAAGGLPVVEPGSSV